MFQPLFDPPSRPTVSEVLDLWYSHTSRSQDAESLKNRLRILNEFRESFGDHLAESLQPLAVSAWVFTHESWKSDWTLFRVFLTLKAPLNWAVRVSLLPRNPISQLSHPKGDPVRPLTEREFLLLLRASKPLFRRVLWFLALTGARPGEIRRIQWADLDFERGAVVLQKHKTRKSLKTPRPRVIVLNDSACRLLAWIRRHQAEKSEFVFLNSKGRQWTRNAVCLRIRSLREKTGIPKDAKLYGLRHRFGTRQCKKGTPLKVLAELMGHSTTRMTEHYTHLAGDIAYLRNYI